MKNTLLDKLIATPRLFGFYLGNDWWSDELLFRSSVTLSLSFRRRLRKLSLLRLAAAAGDVSGHTPSEPSSLRSESCSVPWVSDC